MADSLNQYSKLLLRYIVLMLSFICDTDTGHGMLHTETLLLYAVCMRVFTFKHYHQAAIAPVTPPPPPHDLSKGTDTYELVTVRMNGLVAFLMMS